MTERCQTDGGNIFMSSFSYLANCRCHTGKALKGNYFFFANGTKEAGIRLAMNISKIRSQCMDLDMVYTVPAMPPSRSNGEGDKEFQMRELTHVSFANAEIRNVCLRSFSQTATDEVFFLLQCKSTLGTHLDLSYFWQQKNRDFPPGNRGN